MVLEISPGRTTREHNPFHLLDPVNHTYRIGPGYSMIARLFNGEARVAIPVKSEVKPRFCFQMGPPVIVDVSDEQRLQAVNAQIAADIGIVTASHRSDEIAVVDYEVTNIRRVEPRAELFEVPADYTIANDALGYASWQSPQPCQAMNK